MPMNGEDAPVSMPALIAGNCDVRRILWATVLLRSSHKEIATEGTETLSIHFLCFSEPGQYCFAAAIKKLPQKAEKHCQYIFCASVYLWQCCFAAAIKKLPQKAQKHCQYIFCASVYLWQYCFAAAIKKLPQKAEKHCQYIFCASVHLWQCCFAAVIKKLPLRHSNTINTFSVLQCICGNCWLQTTAQACHQ
jgi:hypothetical protein